MLNSAAKKIAEEFSATILDHNRQELDVSTVRQYVEKIREFGQV
jgi:cell division protein ZipA